MTEQVSWTKTKSGWFDKTRELIADPNQIDFFGPAELRAAAAGVNLIWLSELTLVQYGRSGATPNPVDIIARLGADDNNQALNGLYLDVPPEGKRSIAQAFAFGMTVLHHVPSMPDSWREKLPAIIDDIVTELSDPAHACGRALRGDPVPFAFETTTPHDRLNFAASVNETCLQVWAKHFPHYGIQSGDLSIQPAQAGTPSTANFAIGHSQAAEGSYLLDLNDRKLWQAWWRLLHPLAHEPVHKVQDRMRALSHPTPGEKYYGEWQRFAEKGGDHPGVLTVSPDVFRDAQGFDNRAAYSYYCMKPVETVPLYVGDQVASRLSQAFGFDYQIPGNRQAIYDVLAVDPSPRRNEGRGPARGLDRKP